MSSVVKYLFAIVKPFRIFVCSLILAALRQAATDSWFSEIRSEASNNAFSISSGAVSLHHCMRPKCFSCDVWPIVSVMIFRLLGL